MASVLIDIKAITTGVNNALKNLSQSFSQFTAQQKASYNAGNSFSKVWGAATKTSNGLTNTIGKAASTLTNFNTVARVGASGARAIGTSMIFAGGAFRDLGVAINVAASLFQTFIPVVQSITGVVGGLMRSLSALGPGGAALQAAVALLGVVFAQWVAHIIVGVAELGALGVALYAVAQRGFEFNAIMETTQISIATLVTQFRNLYDVTGQQIGGMKELTDAQIKGMDATQRETYAKESAVAINQKLSASMGLAREAFLTLTVEAAQSPFTTQELAKGFQAVVASLGQYNVSLDDAAKLTVTLGRVASVAGVQGAALASQFTLFLMGAGRITSPLARFAAQIGLTKDKVKELRGELAAARGDTEKSAAIMSVFTTRLSAFDQAGNRIAQSWAGIMSNMTEVFDLFAGAVTTGLFTTIRNSILGVVPITDEAGKKMFDVYDKNFDLIGRKAEGTYKLMEGESEIMATRVTGILASIFQYDDKGFLPTKIKAYSEVFQKAFQPAIQLITELFDMIGTDGASVLNMIAGKLQEVAVFLGDHKGLVFDIYNNFKVLLAVIWDIVTAVASWFGISGDINESTININKSMIHLATTLEGIRVLFDIIKGLLYGLATGGAFLATIFGVIFDVVANIYRKIKAIATLDWTSNDSTLPEWAWNFTDQAWKDMHDAASSSSNAFSDAADSGQRLLGYEEQRNQLTQKTTEYLAQQRKDIDAAREILRDRNNQGKATLDEQRVLLGTDTDVLSYLRQKKLAENEKKVGRTTPRKVPGEGDDGAGKKGQQGRRTLLKSLFAERKAFAEAEVDLIKTKESAEYDAVKTSIERQRDLLKAQLDNSEVSHVQYYAQLGALREADYNAEKQHLLNEIHFAKQAAIFQQDTIESERRDAQTEYDMSKHQAADLAKLRRTNQALDIKASTEKIKAQTAEYALTAKLKALEGARIKEAIVNLRERISAEKELFQTLRDIQTETDSLTKDSSPETRARAEQTINIALAQRYKVLKSELQLNTDGTDVDNERNKLLRDAMKNLGVMRELRVELLKLSYLERDIDRDKEAHEYKINALLFLRSSGAINENEAIKRTVVENRRYADELEKHVQELETRAGEIRAAGGVNTDEFRNVITKIREYKQAVIEARTVTEQVLMDINKNVADAFGTFFEDVQKDVRNIGQAFLSLGNSILGTFQKVIADAATKRFMQILGIDTGQTTGKATGPFAAVGRWLGLDPNSQAAAGNPAKITDESQLGAVLADTGRVIDNAATESTRVLEDTITRLESETAPLTASLNTLITSLDTLNSTILTATPDKFMNVKQDAAGDTVFTEAGGGSAGSAPTKRAAEVLASTLNASKYDGIIDEATDIVYKENGGKIDRNLIHDMLKATMFRESSGVAGQTSEKGAKGLFGILPTTFKGKGNAAQALFAARELVKGYKRGGLKEAFAGFFAGAGGGNRGAKTRDYTTAQSWVIRALEARRNKQSAYQAWLDQEGGGSILGHGVGPKPKLTMGGRRPDGLAPGLMGSGVTPEIIPGAQTVTVTDAATTTNLPKIVTSTENIPQLNQPVDEMSRQVLSYLPNIDIKLSDAVQRIIDKMCACPDGSADKAAGLISILQNIHFGGGGDKGTWPDEERLGASGGHIVGPGGPRDDKIPAWLSNGEYIIQAAAVKQLGLDNLHKLNNAHKMPKFAGGGWFSNIFGKWGKTKKLSTDTSVNAVGGGSMSTGKGFLGFLSKIFGGGGDGKTPTTQGGKNMAALKGGLAMAAISIGFALLGRLFAKKQPKSDPNRVKDPYGLNPDTLTFYKKPIITGSRNYLRNGGPVTSAMLLNSMPKYRQGGLADVGELQDIMGQLGGGGGENVNIKQNINITTPDLHSFRNNKATVARDLARFTQRGLKRGAPKY